MSGAVLRTNASNETTSTSQGTAVVTVARGAVPQDRNVTIFADLEAAFLHGRADVQAGVGSESRGDDSRGVAA